MTKDDAKEVAKKECDRQGWPWLEPVTVSWGVFSFTVRTNATNRGANVTIKVRKKDGAIVSAAVAAY